MSYNELKQHGRPDFPFELYTINRNHPKYEMAFHWHASAEIVRVLSGELTLTLNNVVLTARAGDVIFINSEVIHGATPHDCEYECLVFSLPFLHTGNRLCDQFLDDLRDGHIHIHRRPDARAAQAAAQMFDAMKDPDDSRCFRTLAASYAFLALVQETGQWIRDLQAAEGKDDRSIRKLKKTLSFIRENYDKPITTEDMARVAELSSKYFCSFFKSMTAKTPIAYLTEYRIERAARRLLHSDTPISQIAYGCGFNDLSYFIKTFKARMGVTPRIYRQTVLTEDVR